MEILQQRKIELENQMKPLSDELKLLSDELNSIESEITKIEKEKALLELKRGVNFNVKLVMDGKVKGSSNVGAKVLFTLKEGTIVSAHKRDGSYLYISTYEGKTGWINEVFLQNDEAYKTMMKGFTLLEEEEQSQEKLNKQPSTILSKLESGDPNPTGKRQEDILTTSNYKIINTETSGTTKKTIYIQIPEQLTTQQLEDIATQLKIDNSVYDRLFIFYYLPNMKIGSGAWASTHFNKDLEVRIYGVDKSIEAKVKNAGPSSGELIGKWYDKTPGIEHSIIISKIGSKYILKRAFRDGSVMEKDLKFSLSNGKMKFVYESDVGEYLLIEKNGQLGQYDNQGLIDKCDKIN